MWTSREWALFKKECPPKCYHGKSGRVYSVTQLALAIVINEQVKVKILAKRMNVHTEQVKPSKSLDSFLKHMKERDQ